MIRFCFAGVLAASVLSSAAPAAERQYSVGDFDKIRLVGAAAVVIESARATTVRARGARNAIEMLSVEVQDRILTIQPLAGSADDGQRRGAGPVTIVVTVPLLNGVKLNGSGSLKIAELRGIQGDVSLTGSGQISITRVTVDRLNARLSGSGTLALAGKALNVDANVKGSGSFVAADLNVADLILMAASTGTTKIAASRSAKITSTGAGSVEIIGAPSCTVQNLGSGTVACGK
jgi:Putative auto-transporter adhesin, head GIN domain